MKFLLKLFGFLLVLVLVAALALPLVFDPNDFKQQITEQVEKHTGRQLSLAGDIRLSYFPWLGVELERVSLGNADGFGDKPFVQVDEAGVKVKLLPLLQKRLEVDTVVLKGFKAHLIQLQDGRNNWQDLVKPGDTDKPKGELPLAALLIGGVDLRDGLFIFEDRAAGHGVQLTALNLQTGHFQPGRPVDVEMSSDVQPLPGGTAFRTRIEGRLSFDPASSRLSVAGLRLALAQLDGPQKADLTGQLELDTRMQLLNIKDLQLTGQVQPPGVAQMLSVALNSQLAANLQQLHLSLSPLSMRVSPANGLPAAHLDGALNLDMSKGVAILDQLQVRLGDLALLGQIQASDLSTQPQLSGNLALQPFNPRQVMQSLGMKPPQTADPVVLSKAALKLTLQGTPTKIDFTNLQLNLDDSVVSGKAGLALTGRPKLDFALQMNGIDLNRYMPPPAAAQAGDKDAALPLAALFALEMQGVMGIGNLVVDRFSMENINIKLEQKQAKLTLNHSIGNLYQGKYDGVVVVNAAGAVPTLYYQAKVDGVQAEPLLKAVSGEDRLRGKGSASLELRTQGKTSAALAENVNGDLTFSFRDGAIKGFNLAQTLRDAKASIAQLQGKQPPPAPAKQLETDFTQLDASAKIRGPLVENTALQMKSPFLRFDGKGVLDTQKSWMDYQLTAIVVETSKGQGGKELQDLANIPIPMSYRGPIDEASNWRKWKIHLDKVIEAKLKDKAEEEGRRLLQKKLGLSEEAALSEQELKRQLEEKAKAKLQEELEDKAKDKLKDALKKLF